MTRYFQTPEGVIVRGGTNTPSMGYIEVQIAPLDAIIIERATLRPAKPTSSGNVVYATGKYGDEMAPAEAPITTDTRLDSRADWHRAKARAHLSVAEYLDAHPAVDAEALGALTTVMLEEGAALTTTHTTEALARRMYDRGVRLVEP